MTTFEYLDTDETNRRRELTYGVLREPPAPFFSHQAIVLKVARILCDHVGPRGLGEVALAPVDVVLDLERALVVQPDVMFISNERRSIIRNQVWGAPDLVVEVLSLRTAARDRHEKLEWYRQYGVRECWLIDLHVEQVGIADFTGADTAWRVAYGTLPIPSGVLPHLDVEAAAVFTS